MEWRIGCCGFSKGRETYYQDFDVVEIQQTFYKLPRIDLAMAWRSQAPAEFEFVLKASQLITHAPNSPTYRRLGWEVPPSKAQLYGGFKPSKPVALARAHIERMAEDLKSAVLLYQCPASFKPTPTNIKSLKRFFAQPRRLQYALELRGRDWQLDLIRNLCEELSLIPVVDPLVQRPLVGKQVAYFRLHGLPAFRYSYSYKKADLQRLYDRLVDLPVQRCYVMFNNFRMAQDALTFEKIVESKKPAALRGLFT